MDNFSSNAGMTAAVFETGDQNTSTVLLAAVAMSGLTKF